jgi:GT2 family glycosyltransferase
MDVPWDLDIGLIYTAEAEWIRPLLASLWESRGRMRVRLLLVDNRTKLGPAPWSGIFAETRVIRNPRRLGYGPNLNRIAEHSDAPYLLLLNTDMLFDPQAGCLERMVDFMRQHPECGVAGCRLLHRDGSEGYAARRWPTPRAIAARRLPGMGRIWRDQVADHLYGQHSVEQTFACDWLSGCFLMIRREAREEVGGFDEGFRKYFEDVDYCWRMQQAGWRVMYHGATHCTHFEQRGSRRVVSADAWQHLRSYARWYWKCGREGEQRKRRLAELPANEAVGRRRAA